MQSTPIAVEGWVGVLLVLVAGSPGRGLVFGESAGFGLVLSLVNHVASVDGVPVNDVGCSEAPRAFWTCGAAVCLVCHVEIPRFVKPLTKGTKEPAVGDAVRARLARQRPSVRPGVVVPGRAAAIAQIMQRPAVAVADRLPRSLSRLGSFEGGDDEGGDAAAEDGADNDPWMHAKIEKVLEEGAVVRWATGAQSAVVEVAVVNGEGIEMRANLDLEAANENRHATFVA